MHSEAPSLERFADLGDHPSMRRHGGRDEAPSLGKTGRAGTIDVPRRSRLVKRMRLPYHSLTILLTIPWTVRRGAPSAT